MSVTIKTDSVSGPASYTTGGFTISTGLSTVQQFKLSVQTPGANLPHCHFELSRSGGDVTVKIVKHMHDNMTAFGSVSGLPSGVSAAVASGQTYDADAAHTHSIAHDHAATTSTTPTTAGGGVQTAVGGINQTTHTHSFDVPNFTGNSGAGSSHTHTWDNIYQHQHSVTNTATNPNLTEIANGTDLSGATFNWRAVG